MIQVAHVGFALLCVIASVVKNLLLAQPRLTPADVARVRLFDKLSATAAALLTISGLLMMFWLAKPQSYYLHNSFFWIKIALFICASVLVVWTKIDFKKAASVSPTPWVPTIRVRRIMAFDLLGLVAMAGLGRWIAIGFP